MATFLLFGSYSTASIQDISAKRTSKAKSIIKRHGGRTKAIYALLGEEDLVIIAELAGVEAAMKVSLELNRATGISFRSVPAVAVEEFDKLAAE